MIQVEALAEVLTRNRRGASMSFCLNPPSIPEEEHSLVEQDASRSIPQELNFPYERVENPDQSPWSAHGFIKSVFEPHDEPIKEFYGTGILIAPHVILTAAYVVYNDRYRNIDTHEEGSLPSKIYFYPGHPQKKLEIEGKKLVIHPQYIPSFQASALLEDYLKYDIALIFLEEPAGEHYVSIEALSDEELSNLIISLTGYPYYLPHGGHKIINEDHHQYTVKGHITRVTEHHIFYSRMDTQEGQGGGGICSTSMNQVYAIHRGINRSFGPLTQESFAVRINREILKWINEETTKEQENEAV